MKERAARIHKLISESGKTYQELETITGIKKSSLQRYASGITGKIPLTAIEKLAAAFSVSASYIMWGDDSQKEEMQHKNDILSDIILMLRKDSELVDIVKSLSILDAEKRAAVKSVIDAFSATGK